MPQNIRINLWVKLSLDFFLLLIVAVPILLFYLLATPFKRGFYCDDESIRYPFKDSTVTSGALYAIGTIIPLFFILLIEFFDVQKRACSSVKQEKIRKWIISAYFFGGIFLFGCAVSHFSVDICKYTVGRLRPNFISVCKPDWDKINCSNPESYIQDLHCQSDDRELIQESRLSFISGHASFSTYTMLYLILYLQHRMNLPSVFLLRPVIQFAAFGFALFTSLSRIFDYKHHPTDVLAGAINGLIFAILLLNKSRFKVFGSSLNDLNLKVSETSFSSA